MSAELEAAMAGRNFSSMEEVQTFINEFMNRRNQSTLSGFQGLSPEQMHVFLNRPFHSPHLVIFAEQPTGCETAPIMRLFILLSEAIGEEGIKTTAKGNLPQKFCREAAPRYWSADEYASRTRFGGINREDDFTDLNTTRLVADLAGLIRKYKGRFVLTKKCRKYLDAGDIGGLYRELLRSFVHQFNWAYLDRYEELPIIQQSFLFTLYLLKLHGNTPRRDSFYADCFLDAFPVAADLVEDSAYMEPELVVKNCFSLRALRRFVRFFGLASVEPLDGSYLLSAQGYRVSALPLLAEVVQFRIDRQGH